MSYSLFHKSNFIFISFFFASSFIKDLERPTLDFGAACKVPEVSMRSGFYIIQFNPKEKGLFQFHLPGANFLPSGHLSSIF